MHRELEILSDLFLLLLWNSRLDKCTFSTALIKVLSQTIELSLLSLDCCSALRRGLSCARRLPEDLLDAGILRHDAIIVSRDDLFVELLLLGDQHFCLLGLLLAFHVTSDFTLDSRISLDRALTSLFLNRSANLYICYRLAYEFCALVLLEILLGGTLVLIHHAQTALKRNALLHLGLLDVGLCWGPSPVLHGATHLVIAFNFDILVQRDFLGQVCKTAEIKFKSTLPSRAPLAPALLM